VVVSDCQKPSTTVVDGDWQCVNTYIYIYITLILLFASLVLFMWSSANPLPVYATLF